LRANSDTYRRLSVLPKSKTSVLLVERSLVKLLLLSTLLIWTTAAQDARVILLGTGTPNPEPQHSGPAVAVVSGSNVYIVDTGPGVVRRAVQAGIRMDQLTRVSITHLHSDHTVGLPDLIFTPAVTGRRKPVEIYGPPGLSAMVRRIMQAWSEDMQVRLLSGDTTFSESLIAAAKDCDILVHEFHSQKGWESRTPDWQRYHVAFYTSAPDLGKLAARVRPKKLVLYHELPMGQPPEEVLGEVREYFKGEVIYGKDLDVIR
jgi:ribonuclease BN (tRNA processing enzyme)